MDPIGKIQIGLLEGKSNWDTWKYKVLCLLRTVPKALEVVEGTFLRPTSPATEAGEPAVTTYKTNLEQFVKADANAILLLTTNMKEETLKKVMRFTGAREEKEQIPLNTKPTVQSLPEQIFSSNQTPARDLVLHHHALTYHMFRYVKTFKREIIQDYDYADTISIDTLALEEIVQEERAKEISELNTLSKKVCYLHTSLLYYRNAKSKKGSACYEAWKTLVKKVGGTPYGWRDLGFALGISQEDLDYIANSVKDEPVNVVLKVYLQNDNATLDKILEAFVKLKRYDILKSLQDPLSNLAQCFYRDDSGYYSNSNSGAREIISYAKNLSDDLPPALNGNMCIKNDTKKPNLISKASAKIECNVPKIKNECPILFLTFVEDGFETFRYIQSCVEAWTEVSSVTVITLNNRRDEVFQNPEKFIREYFDKADFIVPIITPGYMNEISSNNCSMPSTSDNLDCKYVNFIYNLIVTYYIHGTGCYNKKVRSVLSQNADANALSRSLAMYPDLMPWTYETCFDEQFKAFLELTS